MSNSEERFDPEGIFDSHVIPISSLGEDYPDPSTDTVEDIIMRMDARMATGRLFGSGEIPSGCRIVLALRHNMFPVELREVKAKIRGAERTLGEVANALPDNSRGVTQKNLASVFGVDINYIRRVERHGLFAARCIINPPSWRAP